MSGYTSYLSNILTHTTSRYNSLRKILLSNEDDGDTEDDSHISRVLRAYYKEKARPLPPWLPPDPNDRRAITPQVEVQSGGGGYFGMRNPYASNVQQQAAMPSNRGSLDDLWGAPAATQQQPTSLRAGRRAPAARTEPQSSLAVPQARPLPSQRAGSYQSQQNSQPAPNAFQRGGFAADPNPSPSAGVTAQDRLKAKLWGRGASSSNSGLSNTSSSSVYDQQAAQNPYDTGNDGGGGKSRRYGYTG